MLLPRIPNRLCEVVRRHGQHQSWKWLLGPQQRAACASPLRDICDWTPRRSTFVSADGKDCGVGVNGARSLSLVKERIAT